MSIHFYLKTYLHSTKVAVKPDPLLEKNYVVCTCYACLMSLPLKIASSALDDITLSS